MFSLESFYQILAQNLLPSLDNFLAHSFKNFGSTNFHDLECVYSNFSRQPNHMFEYGSHNCIIFYDQEPIYENHIGSQIFNSHTNLATVDFFSNYFNGENYFNSNHYILANSEHSSEKTKLVNQIGFYDWYYFFHGFAALDWYKNIRYLPPNRNYSRVFISFNNLCSEKRSYRLNLVARMFEQGLDSHGYISLNHNESLVKQEVYSNDILSKESKKIVVKQLLNRPQLTIDTNFQHGALSANDHLETMCLGLFHIVTETVYYDSKLHLTEKIFKPIAARRPFILVGAPGNLAYLRSYGFMTFDRWIDESYDSETDPDQRIIKIVAEIERICQMSPEAINTMFNDMQSILDYNFTWFYNGFKQHIVNELVDNFQRCLIQINAGRDTSFNNYIDYSQVDFQEIKNRLAQ
jgi:hypothetical protein